jgi:spore coat protein U-like protein
MKISRNCLFFLVTTFAMAPIASANDSDNLNVTATVSDTCTISVVDHVAFGLYNFLDPDAEAIGSLGVQCTAGAQHPIELGEGLNHVGAPTRRMVGPGGAFLNYELYQDLGHTDLWGAGADALDYTEQGAGDILGVNGLLPTGQAVPAGDYSDTVVATILF